MKIHTRTAMRIGRWKLMSKLGSGGNGEVWLCHDEFYNQKAIKLLKGKKNKIIERFKSEIYILGQIKDIEGILPIEEYSDTFTSAGAPLFFIMPVAETCESILSLQTIESKVAAILEIAKTLEVLHSRGITHRDIKPQNILYYKSRFVLSDFGLVDYSDKADISSLNENIGAKWTIAPEMRRESSNADGKKADVYSLAKTLWIFLTGKFKGFDGQYSTGSIIELRNFNRNSFTSTLDNLLIKCTDNDPSKRSTITEFISALVEWQTLAKDFHQRIRREWFEIQTRLFPTSIPERVIWTRREDILKVLKIISSTENLNHVFFPISGGLDLLDVRLATEEDCLELDFQVIEVIKPKRLIFESFGEDPEWNYFRLELDQLCPTVFSSQFEKAEKRVNNNYEDITELAPNVYFPYSALTSDRDDYLINSYGRRIRRRFKGNYVIFGKRSTYNLIAETYDGRHDRLTSDEFRAMIQDAVKSKKSDKEKSQQKAIEDKISEINGPKKFLLEDQDIYRCEKCGNIVDKNGKKLDEHETEYNWAVIRKFGNNRTFHVVGYCCKSDS